MPRKENGMFFELHPGPRLDDEGKPLLYARPVSFRKVSMREVDDYCTRHQGLHRGQMSIAMECFIDVCRIWLANGYRIETPLGVFSPKLQLLGDHTDANKVLSNEVQFVGIDFTPNKRFVRAVIEENRGFRKLAGPVGNAQMHDEAFMRQALKRSVIGGFTTISRFRQTSGLKYHSAQSYLESLCQGDHPRLRRQKIGTTLHYFLVEEEK